MLGLASLLLAPAALAEDAADAAESAGFGITALGWALVASPVIFYAIFNVYRSAIDPKAKVRTPAGGLLRGRQGAGRGAGV